MSDLSNSLSRAGMFCNLCEILTVSSIDYDSKMDLGVCRSCFLKFAEPNRKKWEKGWRPEKSDVDRFKTEIEKSIHSILNEINNYM